MYHLYKKFDINKIGAKLNSSKLYVIVKNDCKNDLISTIGANKFYVIRMPN